MVRAIHARGVVDGVGVQLNAIAGSLDPASLSQPEVPALADDPATQLTSIDPDGVIRLVSDFGVRLGFGLDIGADTAVPQQIHRRQQRCLHDLARRQRSHVRRQPQAHANLVTDRNRLECARIDTATGTNQRGVVVGPRGTVEFRQPNAFSERGRGVGVGVQEHVSVVERGD